MWTSRNSTPDPNGCLTSRKEVRFVASSALVVLRQPFGRPAFDFLLWKLYTAHLTAETFKRGVPPTSAGILLNACLLMPEFAGGVR